MAGFFIVLLSLLALVAAWAWHEAKEKESRMRAMHLSEVDTMPGLEFEHYVAKLLENEGFSGVHVTRASGDFGADLVAQREGRKYAIQAKRYKKNVSRKAVSDVMGALRKYGCDAGIVITNRWMTKDGLELARVNGVQVVDRDVLMEWIYRFSGKPSEADPLLLQHPAARPANQEPAPDAALFVRAAPNLAELAKPMQAASTLMEQDSTSTVETLTVPAEEPEKLVPVSILPGVRKYARSEYPRDLQMQLYTLREECNSYLELEQLRSRTPQEAFDEALAVAREDFGPYEYSMQLSTIREQLEGRARLDSLPG